MDANEKLIGSKEKIKDLSNEELGYAVANVISIQGKTIATLTSENEHLKRDNAKVRTVVKRILEKHPEIDLHCDNCKMAAYGKKDKEDWLHDGEFCDGKCPE